MIDKIFIGCILVIFGVGILFQILSNTILTTIPLKIMGLSCQVLIQFGALIIQSRLYKQ